MNGEVIAHVGRNMSRCWAGAYSYNYPLNVEYSHSLDVLFKNKDWANDVFLRHDLGVYKNHSLGKVLPTIFSIVSFDLKDRNQYASTAW